MIGSSLLLALREIRRHVLRSVLTTLGIVIGVFSVITMVTLGNGATEAIRTSISALGSDVLQVRPGQGGGPGGGGGGDLPASFKPADVESIREQVGGVTAVTGLAQTAGNAIRNASSWSTTISGTTNDYFIAQKWDVSAGRVFTSEEVQSGRSVCVVGATIVANLFVDAEPVGAALRVRGIACTVVGVLEARGQGSFGNDQDDTVIMPIKAVQRRMTGSQDVRAIMIGVDPAFDGDSVRKAVIALLRERRGLRPDQSDDFNVLDAKQISNTVSGTVATLTALIGAVAGVSLLVGGIGIMNIMLVSVTERTREIGIRLAIGALGREVQTQFLVEAVVLSCLGGMTGMLLAFVACLVAAPLMGLPFLFDPWINAASFLFSAAIGVVFGYFPARRAAALNPIEALRYD
jgi:putative ABC transport system permease protein